MLFPEADDSPFTAFQAAEEHDVASYIPRAWSRPSERIPQRPELRAPLNPWVYAHGSKPIGAASDHEFSHNGLLQFRRQLPLWRFTDRVSSRRLDFCSTPAELARFAKDTGSSCSSMFLTQPPVKRVLVAVQGGHMPEERLDMERMKA